MNPSLTRVVRSALLLALSAAAASAMTLEELRSDPNLSPETFATHFSNFKFVFNAVVLKPEVFLGAEAGDCDDYATLAAAELGLRGYHGRLVSVRMKNVVHVICYVTEAKGYLDYNLRAQGSGLVSCGSELPDMADTVAKSFKLNWTSVSEFTFNDGVKRLVKTTLARDLEAHN
jgi:hypothetical protein